MREACACGHSDNSHVYPGSTLFGDCHECRFELYNPPGGLKGVPLHPLFAFTENEFRFVSCAQCSRFRVLPGGVCEGCGWDNDNHGIVEDTRPNYCRDSPTKTAPHTIHSAGTPSELLHVLPSNDPEWQGQEGGARDAILEDAGKELVQAEEKPGDRRDVPKKFAHGIT